MTSPAAAHRLDYGAARVSPTPRPRRPVASGIAVLLTLLSFGALWAHNSRLIWLLTDMPHGEAMAVAVALWLLPWPLQVGGLISAFVAARRSEGWSGAAALGLNLCALPLLIVLKLN